MVGVKVRSIFFFFLREFQLMASAPDDGFLSSDQDTKSVFGVGGD